MKSSRRRARWDSVLAKTNPMQSFAGSQTGVYKKLTLALTIMLGGLLGALPPFMESTSVAYAAEGETTASGLLSYNVGGASSKSIFSDWQEGTVTQAGNSYKTIVLNTSAPKVVNPDNGSALVFNKNSFDTIVNYYNSSAGGSKNYDTIIAVIYVPDPSNPGATIPKTYKVYTASEGLLISYVNLVNPALFDTQGIRNIGSDYWCTPEIAQQIYQAEQAVQSSDPAIKAAGEAKLMQLISNGLPHLYTAQGDDWQNGTMLTLGTSASPFKFTSRMVTLPSSPSDSTYSYSYQSRTVGEGGVWRPMDRLESTSAIVGSYSIGQGWVINADGTVTQVGTTTTSINNGSDSGTVVTGPTAITVKDLTVGKNGTIDLSYINTTGADPIANRINGGLYTADFNGTTIKRAAWRTLLVQNATLADETIFRLGSYRVIEDGGLNETTKVQKIDNTTLDQVFITNGTAPDGHSQLYIQLGWVPGVGTTNQGAAVSEESNLAKPVLLGILNGANNFTVTGQTSRADGVFSQYEITPVIGQLDNYFTNPADSSSHIGTAWYLDSYSYLDLDTVSESGRSVSDNAVVMNNLWKSNYLNLFRRVGNLHRKGYLGEQDQKENVWADTWHGKYKSASGYGRQVNQTYNGMQVGYDKLLNNKVGKGKVYTGFSLSKVEGDSHTATGGGDQESNSIGIYGAWVGDKGHYLDASFLAAKLKDNYHLIGNTGEGSIGRVNGDYDTWAYGLGLQYGYQTPRRNGWFWEPSATLFVGRTDGASYRLSNNLGIQQDSYNTVTGRLGLSVGKELDGGSNLYAGVAALHDFSGPSSIRSFYGTQQRALEAAGGKDTWWEFSLGGNRRISPTGVFNLDLSKTVGSSIGNEWRINGGFNWTWSGFGSSSKGAAKDSEGQTVVQDPDVPVKEAASVSTNNLMTKIQANQVNPNPDQPAAAHEGMIMTSETGESSENVVQHAADSELPPADTMNEGEYSFAPITVEAIRPNWEKKLSPGQVSIIYPEKFEGEQKDLPALLERVPGMFVQRVSGDGHYTVARVRGATGAQVNVYVDGVLMNLNGDSAVNLSTIPVDNVERIEVYRGYVPARFSGSPLGGVINIITKKPDKVGGSISQGMKSYGGYTGNYQVTAPLGDGSLMATYQRDIWGGDYPFTISPDNYNGHEFGDTHRRSNGYQNSNGMVKWQNDNWTVKTAWKNTHEQLPRSVSRLSPEVSSSYNYEDYHKGLYDADQNIDQKEFQIGWRDTKGNLDWGWKLYYLDSQKNYRNVGLLRQGYTEGNFASYPGLLWSDFHSKKWGGNLNTALKMGSSHLVEMNFEYSRETMDADGSNWKSFDDSMTHLNRQFIPQYKIQEYHLTLQDTITLNQGGDFKFTPVLRADRVVMDTMADNDKKWQYSGAAALQKQLNKNWSIKTSWGTYNRHPNFYELFGDGATIRPNKGAAQFFDVAGDGTWETGHQFDFSINWQGELAKADTDTSLTWFQRRSKNQFALWQPNVPNAPASYFPMDDARVHGIELTHNMKWQRLNLSMAGTWQTSRYSGNNMGGNYNGMKSNISYTPEWVWNARVDYLFPGDKLNVFTEYTYTDKQFLGADDNDGRYMQAVSTVDLGFKYAFDQNWKLSAGVNDLFNKGYKLRQIGGSDSSTLAYPLAGRMYYATMEYKF
jgi:outer membrane autotransporter protein